MNQKTLLLLTGPSGVGKRPLVHALTRVLAARGRIFRFGARALRRPSGGGHPRRAPDHGRLLYGHHLFLPVRAVPVVLGTAGYDDGAAGLEPAAVR